MPGLQSKSGHTQGWPQSLQGCFRWQCVPAAKSVQLQVRRWDDLPKNAKDYIARIQDLIGVKIEWIGVGPGRDAIVIQP